MLWATNRHIRVGHMPDSNYVGIGSKPIKTKSLDEWERLVKLCDILITPRTEEEAWELVEKIGVIGAKALFQTELERLKERHFIIPTRVLGELPERTARYRVFERLGRHPQTGLNKRQQSSVIILGVGDIGNHVAAMLATAGVGKLILVDGDRVELSNLTRQMLFTETEVGKKKVVCLEAALRARNKTVRIETQDRFITAEEDLELLPNADFLVLSADNPDDIGIWVNDFCLKRRLPWIVAGYFNDIAAWGPLIIPGKGGCLRCYETRECKLPIAQAVAEAKQRINERYQVPSYAPTNAVAAAMCVHEVLAYLGEFGQARPLTRCQGFSIQEGWLEAVDYSPSKTCRYCQSSVAAAEVIC